MPSRPINQIRETTGTYEYEDELVVAIDFGTTAGGNIHAEKIDNLLMVSYTHPEHNETSIEFKLPETFINPDITVNNGVITVTQEKEMIDADEAEDF